MQPGEIWRRNAHGDGTLLRAVKVRLTGRAIFNGPRGIARTLRLAAYFGTEPQFWMNLQQAYDLKTTEAAKGAAIRKQVDGGAA